MLPVCLNVSMHLDPRFGGLAMSVPRFCETLAATGRYEAPLAVFAGADEISPDESQLGCRIHRFPLGRWTWMSDAAVNLRLANLVRNASVVHIHGIWREHCSRTAALCRQFGKPYVVSAHGMLEPWALRRNAWKKRIYWEAIEERNLRGAFALRALTRAESDDYGRLGLQNPVRVIPNGIDLMAPVPTEVFLKEFPSLRGQRRILFLGRLHVKKGLDMLCRAWSRIESRFPDAHLVIAGPDEDGTLARLQSLAQAEGLSSRTTFTGALTGTAKWAALRSATVFVLPSHSEGFSVAVLEALANGVPAILTRACHFPEVVSARCGWEIQGGELPLSECLAHALSLQPAELSAMGASGRELVANRFAWRQIASDTADILDERSRPW